MLKPSYLNTAILLILMGASTAANAIDIHIGPNGVDQNPSNGNNNTQVQADSPYHITNGTITGAGISFEQNVADHYYSTEHAVQSSTHTYRPAGSDTYYISTVAPTGFYIAEIDDKNDKKDEMDQPFPSLIVKETQISENRIKLAEYTETGDIDNETKIEDGEVSLQKHTYDNQNQLVQVSHNKSTSDANQLTKDLENAVYQNISSAEQISLGVEKDDGTTYGAGLNAERLTFGNIMDDGTIDPSVELSKDGLVIHKAPTDGNQAVRKSDLDSQVNALQSRINQLGSFSVDTSGIGANARKISTLENSNAGQNTAINSNKAAISANTAAVSSLDTRVKALEAAKNNTATLNKDLKKGMAKQAALNGLFQPYGVGKLSTTAALGGSGKETAVAVGAGYRFNQNLATKGGVAFSSDSFSSENQDYSYNIGVSYEW